MYHVVHEALTTLPERGAKLHVGSANDVALFIRKLNPWRTDTCPGSKTQEVEEIEWEPSPQFIPSSSVSARRTDHCCCDTWASIAILWGCNDFFESGDVLDKSGLTKNLED